MPGTQSQSPNPGVQFYVQVPSVVVGSYVDGGEVDSERDPATPERSVIEISSSSGEDARTKLNPTLIELSSSGVSSSSSESRSHTGEDQTMEDIDDPSNSGKATQTLDSIPSSLPFDPSGPLFLPDPDQQPELNPIPTQTSRASSLVNSGDDERNTASWRRSSTTSSMRPDRRPQSREGMADEETVDSKVDDEMDSVFGE